MNILMVNWSWYPSGGDWTAVENLSQLYQMKGHKVIPFSMVDKRNYITPYEKYFVSNIDYKVLNKQKSISNGIKVLKRSIYSAESRLKLKQLLDDVKIDIAHLHNLGPQITPSILSVLKERNIPIIWTLHDYGMLCPATSFVSKDEICERCKNGRFFYCFFRKCKKDSYQASFVAALRSYILKFLDIQKYVDVFICPSKFLKSKFIEFGFDKERFEQLYNPYDIDGLSKYLKNSIDNHDNYILYVGRVEKVKGVMTLIKAFSDLKEIQLLVVGSGEKEEEYKKYVMENGLENIHFLGHLEKEKVIYLIKGSQFTVCPSEWYENLPYSVVEAMLLGKPVVGSRIGGIPELVIDGLTGFTFIPGDAVDLKNKITDLLSDRKKCEVLGSQAQKHVTALVNLETHYKNMERIFQKIIRN